MQKGREPEGRGAKGGEIHRFAAIFVSLWKICWYRCPLCRAKNEKNDQYEIYKGNVPPSRKAGNLDGKERDRVCLERESGFRPEGPEAWNVCRGGGRRRTGGAYAGT